MKKWTRFCCFALALLLVLSVMPRASAETGVEENAPVDFVVVLDLSNSIFEHDKDRLCLASVDTLIGNLPVQNARVGVIGFGYGGKDYKFSSKFSGTSAELNMSGDAGNVHEIIPLSSTSGNDARETYRNAIDQAAEDAQAAIHSADVLYSPIVPALGAAVDMLEQNGSVDGHAGIILVSDGVPYNRARNYDYKPVTQVAKEHQWPIYSIELNYANPNRSEVKQAQKLLDDICASSGKRSIGREYCATPTDVFVAFTHIFYDLMKYPEPIPENWPMVLNIPGEFAFTVPELTSEATVTVFGAGVQTVTLVDPDGKKLEISGNYTQENFVAVVEKDKYFSLKMICPKDGEWSCQVKGAGDAVLAVSMDIQEMGISAVGTPGGEGKTMQKQEVIRVDACFSYQNYEVHGRDIYKKTVDDVRLLVKHANGQAKEYPMQADEQGYYCEVSLNDFPCGEMTLQVVMEDNMFRSGRQVSNALTYTTENLPVKLTGTGPDHLEGYVNGNFERIDLTSIFENPDKDTLTYNLECSDKTADLAFTVDGDFMTVSAGLVPGTYNVVLTAKDPDMTKPEAYALTMTVVDRVPEVKQPKAVELWLDYYGFQKAQAKKSAQLDLDEYMIDPDGVKLSYTVETEDAGVVQAELEDHVLNLLPISKGKATVQVTANDGVSDVQTQVWVTVTSGKAAFWRNNWIYFVLGTVALVAAVLTIIILLKNKRVKGNWEITVDDNGTVGAIDQMNIASYTKVGKKAKFLLRDLINELIPFMDAPVDQNTVLSYFGGDNAKVELAGVIGKTGCEVRNIPASVQVTVNGVTAQKRAKISGGTLAFAIVQPTGEILKIQMRLR